MEFLRTTVPCLHRKAQAWEKRVTSAHELQRSLTRAEAFLHRVGSYFWKFGCSRQILDCYPFANLMLTAFTLGFPVWLAAPQ